MLRTIIIDDESRARSALKQEIELNCPEIELVGEADSIASALALIRDAEPELIFLDIQLRDGLGFTVLDRTGTDAFSIVFTTAYSEYALKAFKTNAADYLLKSIDSDELKQAVHKVLQIRNQRQLTAGILPTSEALNQKQQKKIILQSSDGVHILLIADILRCNSYGNYTFVFLKDGAKILVPRMLKEIEENLAGLGFERVHHSHLINLDHVRSFRNKEGGVAVMSDGSEVPVSMRKKSAFLEQLNRLNKKP